MAAKKAPWRKLNPKKKKKRGPHKLSPAQKVRAKGSGRKAGRPYPNLVDNMLVAEEDHEAPRTDGACIVRVEPGKARCRFHGGLSHSRPPQPLLGVQTASVAHSAD